MWGSDAIEQMLVEIRVASTPAPKVRTPEILLPLGRTPVTRVLSFDYIGAILRVYTRSSALFVAPSLRILWPVAAPLLAVTFVFARRVLVSIAHIFALPKLVPPRPALQVRLVRLRQSCWRLDLWDGDGQPKAKWEEQEGPGRHGALHPLLATTGWTRRVASFSGAASGGGARRESSGRRAAGATGGEAGGGMARLGTTGARGRSAAEEGAWPRRGGGRGAGGAGRRGWSSERERGGRDGRRARSVGRRPCEAPVAGTGRGDARGRPRGLDNVERARGPRRGAGRR